MTEKRFIVAICGDGKLGIRDLTTLNEYTSERQVADYMNRITDENEQLKKELHQQEVSEQRRKEYDDFWKEKISKVIV